MSNKFLGNIALLGAPFLLLGIYTETVVSSLSDSWFTGVWGMLYITGWMASMIVLQRMEAAGAGKFGRMLISMIIFSLAIANASNVVKLISANDKPSFFFYIDLCWPFSNVLMLVLGITIMIKKSLPAPTRWIPLACGLWLPLAMLSMVVLGKTLAGLFFAGSYSVIFWALLARMVRKVPDHKIEEELLDTTVSII